MVRWTDDRKGERTTDLLTLSKSRQLRTFPRPDLMSLRELSASNLFGGVRVDVDDGVAARGDDRVVRDGRRLDGAGTHPPHAIVSHAYASAVNAFIDTRPYRSFAVTSSIASLCALSVAG